MNGSIKAGVSPRSATAKMSALMSAFNFLINAVSIDDIKIGSVYATADMSAMKSALYLTTAPVVAFTNAA